jgi:hypothetical protein
VSQVPTSRADGIDLGMGRGIHGRSHQIYTGSDDVSVPDNHRAKRPSTSVNILSRQANGFPHESDLGFKTLHDPTFEAKLVGALILLWQLIVKFNRSENKRSPHPFRKMLTIPVTNTQIGSIKTGIKILVRT